ncbi:hypothetical protein RBG61_00430 [Paludicola sp. MB14-C6]|uniref:hypothetical protein n=1 Tax=Paludihabitans sp. MB14-C6 TaxID=3070656 RepID=UPI0027DBE3C8|nr:hypothetical protein [Paludicola sp. MB14-C6]WMJ23156.1 hypothetical protein RBG61_00430 [Paludicola sp. MB14-C6]
MVFNGYLMSGEETVAEVRNNQVIPILKDKMPLYLANGGNFEQWLESRAIDRHRPNSRILKKMLRLTDTSDIASVIHSHAATITDNYWVKSNDEDLQYGDIEFKENIFADISLTGSVDSYNKIFTKEQLSSRTPELTNIGSYEKCWKFENGSWYMYKQGSALERFSEVFIAILSKKLGFPTAEYSPSDSFIKTKDFTEGKNNFEPMAALVGDNEDYSFNYDKLNAIDLNLAKEYLDILFMDTLCFNMDRHTYNYGLLRDRETGKILSMAPNFDNNIALISRGYATEAKNSSNLLIELFGELLKNKSISYKIPYIDETMIKEIAIKSLPNEKIDIKYVTDFVMDRSERIESLVQSLEMKPKENLGIQFKY